MRTTLNIEDEILQRARRVAERSRLSFRDTINRALRAGLDQLDPQRPKSTYRCTTFAMGFPPARDLDKALQLAALLDDEDHPQASIEEVMKLVDLNLLLYAVNEDAPHHATARR